MLLTPKAIAEGGDPVVPELSEAYIRDQVEREIMCVLPQPMDARLYAEAKLVVNPVIDEIVAQCLRNPSMADTIISTMVSSAVSTVRQDVERAEEVSHRLRGNSVANKKPKKKVSFKYNRDRSHFGTELTENDTARIEAAMEDIFGQEIPEHAEFVNIDGGYYWRIALEGDDRFVLIEAAEVRMVTVVTGTDGRIKIIEQMAPTMAGAATATSDAVKEVLFQTREIIWDRNNIREALGSSFSDIDDLADLLRQREELMDRLMMIFQAEQERMQKELEELAKQQMEKLPFENIYGMPEVFDTGLTDDRHTAELTSARQPVFA